MHDVYRPVVLILALLAAVWLAAPAAAAPAGADSEEAAQLLEQLAERYEVLTLEESWVLRPSAGSTAFDVIEIRPGTASVDGERRTRDELRELIGDGADLMYSLAELAGEAAGLPADRGEDDEEAPRRIQRRSETDTRVSFASSLTVEEDESVRDVVVIGGSLEVLGEIDGDAVAVGGSIEVQGEIDGNVTAVGGSVSLGPDAVVDGDVAAIGGAVHREPGAEVRGGITELSLGDWEGFDGFDLDFGPWWPSRRGLPWADFAASILRTVMLGFLVLLTALIARGYVGSAAARAAREPWKAGLVGLIAEVLFVPLVALVAIILAVSVIGIPLAILWVLASVLGLVLTFLVGYTAVAQGVGGAARTRFQLGNLGPYVAVLVGLVLIQGCTIFAEALSILGGPIRLIAWLLILTGFLVKFVAWTVGLGAVLLHGFSPLPAGDPRVLPSYPPRSSPPPPPPPPRPVFEPLPDPHAEEDAKYAEAAESSRPGKPEE